MKSWASLIAVTMGALIMSSCSGSVTADPPSSKEAAIANELFGMVNAKRQAAGLNKLKPNGTLNNQSRKHTKWMMENRAKFRSEGRVSQLHNYGSHSRSYYATQQLRVETVSENVIAGWRLKGDIAQGIFDGWVRNKRQREQMMDDYYYTGIGVDIDDEGYVFAVQMFTSAPRPRGRSLNPNVQ